SLFDNPKSYNSDKFTRATMAYLRGLMFLNIIPPILRRYVPFFKRKEKALVENADYIIKTLNNMIEKRNFDF
ncbi:6156_t:CDS:1, partial [Racocetra fulgida]